MREHETPTNRYRRNTEHRTDLAAVQAAVVPQHDWYAQARLEGVDGDANGDALFRRNGALRSDVDRRRIALTRMLYPFALVDDDAKEPHGEALRTPEAAPPAPRACTGFLRGVLGSRAVLEQRPRDAIGVGPGRLDQVGCRCVIARAGAPDQRIIKLHEQ